MKTQIEHLGAWLGWGEIKKTHNKAGSMIRFLENKKCSAELATFKVKVCRQRSMLISCHSQRSRSQDMTRVSKSKKKPWKLAYKGSNF